MISQTLLIIFSAWILGFVFQLIVFPIIFSVTRNWRLFDRGWAFSRMIGWLASGLVIWFLSHLRLPVNTNLGFVLTLVLLGFLSFKKLKKKSLINELKKFLRKNKKILVIEELIFLSSFLFLTIVRSYGPDVLDLEKFMDAGLMQSYFRSPTLPIEDMWLAGRTFNYYTFGHFLGSLLMRLWQQPIEISYNLSLGWIMGLVLMQSFALIGYFLQDYLPAGFKIDKLKKKQNKLWMKALISSGILAVLLIGFGGNSHSTWYLLKNQSFNGYWYPDATRFIERTIHEFPAYSFVVSDLHAHLWSLPIVLLTIVVIRYWYQVLLKTDKKKSKLPWKDATLLKTSSLVGVCFGVLMMTSTWDMLIYGMLLMVLGVLIIIFDRKKFWYLGFSALMMAVAASFIASLWLAFFESISQGVFLVYENSPLWQMLVLWLGHLIMSLIALVLAKKLLFFPIGLRRLDSAHQTLSFLKKTKKINLKTLLPISIVLTAWILLALPEIIYFKDIYPNHPRANTMFKLTFQAFIMMSLMGAWALGILQLRKKIFSNKILQNVLKILLFVLTLGFMTYPFFTYKDYYGLKRFEGIDGLNWMRLEKGLEYEGVMWLRDNIKGRPVILEAVGESYTRHARISTFTGLPTVIGWRVHEWLWRGGFDIPSKRTEDVRIVYEEPSSLAAQRVLNQYKVKYIYIGALERKTYSKINTKRLEQLGEIIYHRGTVMIVELE